jgi:hypothetical protein
MKAAHIRIIIFSCCIVLILTACLPSQMYIYEGGQRIPQNRFNADMRIYQTYRDLNTLEGYHEFLQNYPDNVFATRAREEIEQLEFKPYEQQDTIEGYLEFKMLYPHSPHVKKANWRIEQVEIRRYDSLDTVEGYQEFLEKYPRSIFADSARERLQELSFREQNRRLRERFGFDLLKYRHDVRRAQSPHDPLWDFTVFAGLRESGGRSFFVTRLLYGTPPDIGDDTMREKLKTGVAVRMFGMIADQGRNAVRLPQPVFEICHAPGALNDTATVLLSFESSPDGIRQVADGRMPPGKLLTPTRAPAATPSRPPTHTAQPSKSLTAALLPLPRNPTEIMRRVATVNSFEDAVLSRRWETRFSDGSTQDISVIEKQRRYPTQNAVRSATVLRYLETVNTRSDARRCASAILHQRSLKAGDRYWYIMRIGDAGRTLNIETYRPDAENNFFLEQYVDLLPEAESHALLEFLTHEGRPAALIKSTPLKNNSYYAWRRSLIDLERMVPLMIEYYDERGELHRDVAFSWLQSLGIWYWDVAMHRNLADGSTTRIATTDIRINLGLPESAFQPGALQRLSGR